MTINTNHRLYSKKTFYITVTLIALPIVLQNILQNLLVFIDKFMVSTISEEAFTAVGIVNQYQFILTLMLYGIGTGLAIYGSQFFGDKNYGAIQKVMGLGIVLAFICSVFMFIPAYFFPEFIFSLYNVSDTVTNYGVSFIKIVSFTFFIASVEFAIAQIFRSIGKVFIPTIFFVISIFINTILNAILIHGHLGAPKLGIEGAGYATLTAKLVGFTLILIYLYFFKYGELKFSLKTMFSFDFTFFKKIFKKSAPVFLNESLWGVGVTILALIYAIPSEDSLTAYMASNDVLSFSWVFALGLATAAGVILGQTLGENNIGNSKVYAYRFIKVNAIIGIVLAVLAAVFAPMLVELLDLSDSIISTAKTIIYIQSALFIFKNFNTIFTIGIFKAGGDTIFAMMFDSVPLLFISVPLGFIAAQSGANILLLIFITNAVEIVKIPISIWRFKSNKWANNIVST